MTVMCKAQMSHSRGRVEKDEFSRTKFALKVVSVYTCTSNGSFGDN